MGLEYLLQQLAMELKNRQLTLATAESCTGGGLSYVLTSLPGSSAWLDRGFVTYSNQAKIELLGVNNATINREGAVSEAVAREMATGALNHSQATISIAITGIAGADGGTTEKPVGTVWIAWMNRDGRAITKCYQLDGDREIVRKMSILRALERLHKIF